MTTTELLKQMDATRAQSAKLDKLFDKQFELINNLGDEQQIKLIGKQIKKELEIYRNMTK